MSLKTALRNVSPLAWCLGVSAVANAVTMFAVLDLVSSNPRIYIRGGHISASIGGSVDINDRSPVRVQVIGR